MIKVFQHPITKETKILTGIETYDDLSDMYEEGYILIASQWEENPHDNHAYIELMERNGHEEIDSFCMRTYIEENY